MSHNYATVCPTCGGIGMIPSLEELQEKFLDIPSKSHTLPNTTIVDGKTADVDESGNVKIVQG